MAWGSLEITSYQGRRSGSHTLTYTYIVYLPTGVEDRRFFLLASVNENSHSPDTKTKMGDHPVVWTNEHSKARNIYIFMGHHPGLFDNPAFTTIFRNSIFWAAYQQPAH